METDISASRTYGSALEGDSKFGEDYPWRRGGELEDTRVVLWGTEMNNIGIHGRRWWRWTKR